MKEFSAIMWSNDWIAHQ